MANVPALGMKSLEVHLEVQGADSAKIFEVFDRVRSGVVPTYHTESQPQMFQDDPPALFSVGEMPIKLAGESRKTKHAVGIILNHTEDIDISLAREAMLVNNYGGLPQPLRPSSDWEVLYTMQVVLAPSSTGDGTDILKYYMFPQPQPLGQIETRLIAEHEVLHLIDWGQGGDVKTPWKVFLYMLDRMGGTHFRYHLPPQANNEKGKKECLSEDAITAQYQFIKDNAPRGNFDCEQMMWIDFQMNDPQSPVHNWREAKIKEVLSHVKEQSIQAKKIKYMPLTIFDCGDEGVERAKRMVPTFRSHSCLMVGEPGEGKTPYLEIMSFAMADFYADYAGDRSTASYRIAPDLDFFRAEEGTVQCPCVFDDGDLFEQRPKTLKAFLDVSQFQAMTRERWGAAKFVRGQARFASENMYDEQAVPSWDDWRGLNVLPEKKAKEKRNQFLFDMLRPTFPKGMSKANVNAILKRATVVMNTKDYVFERLAGVESDVTREVKRGHFITKQAGTTLYNYYEKQITRDAEEYSTLRDKQLRFMKALLNKGDLPQQVSVKGETVKREIVDDDGDGSEAAPREPMPSLAKRVKWAKDFGSMPVSIDLSTPPRNSRGSASTDVVDPGSPITNTQQLQDALEEALENGVNQEANEDDPMGWGGGMDLVD